MSKFTVAFCTDNAAFEGDSAGYEIARILRELADRVEDSGLVDGVVQRIRDINGARVGYAAYEADGAEE
jgi:hypothetical protein